MKKVILIGVLATVLAGCQSAGPNQTVGTGVGAVAGYGVARALGAGSAGSAIGAVAGAVVGSEVGRSMDQPRVQTETVYVAPPVPQRPPRRQCYSTWDRTAYGMRERVVCNYY